jgi:hypothetical protein
MKASLIILVLTAGAFLASCKKEYICECHNPGGTYTAFRVKDSKKNAKRQCEEYYNQNFGSVAFSETSCEVR